MAVSKWIIVGIVVLAGCSGPVVTDAVVRQDTPVAVPTPEPLTLNSVQWQVLTLAQMKALVAKLQTAQQNNTVLFALDTQDYTNLQLNFVQIERYISEQKAILAMLQQIISERAGQPASKSTSNSK